MTTLADIVMQTSAQKQRNFDSTLSTVIGTSQWLANHEMKQKEYEQDKIHKEASRKYMDKQSEAMDINMDVNRAKLKAKEQEINDRNMTAKTLKEFAGTGKTHNELREELLALKVTPEYAESTVQNVYKTEQAQRKAEESEIAMMSKMSKLHGQKAQGILENYSDDPQKAREMWSAHVQKLKDQGMQIEDFPAEEDIIKRLQTTRDEATSLETMANRKSNISQKRASAYETRLYQELAEFEKLPDGPEKDKYINSTKAAIEEIGTKRMNTERMNRLNAAVKQNKLDQEMFDDNLAPTYNFMGISKDDVIGDPAVEADMVNMVARLKAANVSNTIISRELKKAFVPTTAEEYREANKEESSFWDTLGDLEDKITGFGKDYKWYKLDPNYKINLNP